MWNVSLVQSLSRSTIQRFWVSQSELFIPDLVDNSCLISHFTWLKYIRHLALNTSKCMTLGLTVTVPPACKVLLNTSCCCLSFPSSVHNHHEKSTEEVTPQTGGVNKAKGTIWISAARCSSSCKKKHQLPCKWEPNMIQNRKGEFRTEANVQEAFGYAVRTVIWWHHVISPCSFCGYDFFRQCLSSLTETTAPWGKDKSWHHQSSSNTEDNNSLCSRGAEAWPGCTEASVSGPARPSSCLNLCLCHRCCVNPSSKLTQHLDNGWTDLYNVSSNMCVCVSASLWPCWCSSIGTQGCRWSRGGGPEI